MIIFKNLPERTTEKELKKAVGKFFLDGGSYKKTIHVVRRAYLRAALIRMRERPNVKIAKKIGITHGALNYLLKKYNLKKGGDKNG